MALIQKRSKRKPTGGRYKARLAKLLSRKGSHPSLTKIGERKVKLKRCRGGNEKLSLLAEQTINLFNPSTKKTIKTTATRVIENPANRHFIRRNILTKGAIVETPKGTARITSRPGQEGSVNAVLLKKE
ncbi:30S ribosomal protein S8e [Candidatus Woesearchaeota archaeon]|nr:MAG: 30S ribosomal protein S8e [Candidatus Woesearchaeota archaeon]